MGLGSVRVYRIYDIAHEVFLDRAFEKLKALRETQHYSLKKPSKDFLFRDAALVLKLNDISLEGYDFQVTVKVWSYGAISFCLNTHVPEAIKKNHLTRWIKDLSLNAEIDSFCQKEIEVFYEILKDDLIKPSLWNQLEEYNIFVANTESEPLSFWKEDNFIYQFLSLEPEIPLSEAMIEPIKDCSLSYGPDDLVVVDWDTSFVYSSDDVSDICDVLELANVQLLELRYFDDLLDKKISGLYRQVIEKRPTIFNSTINLLARDASRLYIEISEVVERIENSLKVIGDIYFARLYRLGIKRLQVTQWQSNVDNKLKNLLDISQMYMGELNNKRSHFMEIVIILLIAIEVVPFVSPYVTKYGGMALGFLRSASPF